MRCKRGDISASAMWLTLIAVHMIQPWWNDDDCDVSMMIHDGADDGDGDDGTEDGDDGDSDGTDDGDDGD
eukprot:5083187-Pyramimonas_sp.AAC.1